MARDTIFQRFDELICEIESRYDIDDGDSMLAGYREVQQDPILATLATLKMLREYWRESVPARSRDLDVPMGVVG